MQMSGERDAKTAAVHGTKAVEDFVCRNAESLLFCGTSTPTPGLENLGLQTKKTWIPTPDPKSDSDSDFRTYCVTY